MIEHAYLIPLIPFAASLIMMFGAKEDPHSPAPWIGIGAMAICLGLSLSILSAVAGGSVPLPYEHNWQWFSFAASIGGKSFIYDMPIGVLIDGPAALLLVVVTLVSLMVQIYSIAYMHEDTRYKRYFAFVSFFTASMLGLVVSSNILVGFMSWELMGLSSYLLIGFWFEKDGPTEAQKKAFMTTKLGDSGLYLALLFIFAKVGSFQITQIHQFINQGYMTPTVATVIAVGILFGAMGKSAQFPLFIWLPDAMEGPTPGSALIHAATMVAAGIFVVARLYFVFLAAPDAMLAAAWIGCATAFLAAAMALVSYDIKRVLAFSTVSQLGFMMCALGVGGYTAGLFHLTTHAFFKALLFLGAGSVIHSVHTNDMRLMGGLSKKMPVTFVTMLAAIFAIAGVPFTSGYYSKDMILANIYQANRPIFWIMLFTALMTAFYMSRLFILTFWGDDRDHEKYHHAHESPFLITGPLVLLAFLALVSGYMLERNELVYRLLAKPTITAAQAPAAASAEAKPAEAKPAEGDSAAHAAMAAPVAEAHAPVAEARAAAAEHAEAAGEAEHHEGHLPHWLHLALPFMIFGSMGLAFVLYKGPRYEVADGLKTTFAPIFHLLDRRWFLDDAFDLLVVLCDKAAALAYWIDANVVDRVFVDGWGLLMRIVAEISNLVDALFVDRTVDGFGGLTLDLGVGLRSLVKDGQVQEYLMYVAIAFSLAATLILTR
ncbi:MAG: NADH-quinone oxidoreductase subunit L [Elusimicrobia bacterium]|nr:NADH-quinone oxidoreductase subunit L [Elusimicrobiota bacterium]